MCACDSITAETSLHGNGKFLLRSSASFLRPWILAAIQQIAFVADRQLMHGAGYHLGRAPECQFHPLKNTLRTQVNPRLVTESPTGNFRMDA